MPQGMLCPIPNCTRCLGKSSQQGRRSLAQLAGGWRQGWGQGHIIPRCPQPRALSSPSQALPAPSKRCQCCPSVHPVVPRALLPSTSAGGCSPASGPTEGNKGGGGDSVLTARGSKESGSGCVSTTLPAGGRGEAIHVRALRGRRCHALPSRCSRFLQDYLLFPAARNSLPARLKPQDRI